MVGSRAADRAFVLFVLKNNLRKTSTAREPKKVSHAFMNTQAFSQRLWEAHPSGWLYFL